MNSNTECVPFSSEGAYKPGERLQSKIKTGQLLHGKPVSSNCILRPTCARHFKAYIVLLTPWSRVRLCVRQQFNRPQFSILATEDIEADTLLYELIGTMSTDTANKISHTNQSTMFANDGSERILSGPVRIVNHHCSANTAVNVPSDLLFLFAVCFFVRIADILNKPTVRMPK